MIGRDYNQLSQSSPLGNNERNRSRGYPVHPQFEGVRHKFSVPPSAVGFPLICRKIEPDPVYRERLPLSSG